jgi:hypothetical protein
MPSCNYITSSQWQPTIVESIALGYRIIPAEKGCPRVIATWRKIHWHCHKKWVSLLKLIHTGRCLLDVWFKTSPKLSLSTALTTHNTTENNNRSRTKHYCTSAKSFFFFQLEHIFAGHQQRTVGFIQHKSLPRSTANSTVNIDWC